MIPHDVPGAVDDAATLAANRNAFQRLVRRAEAEVTAGRVTEGTVLAELTALSATWHHTGMFASPELEGVLARAAAGFDLQASPQERRSRPVRPVLHVSTFSRPLGGVSQLVPRWISLDSARRHDVALTRQGYVPLPSALRRAVDGSGGRIHRLDTALGGLAGQARSLRALAAAADFVVLHVETDDVLPLLSLQSWDGPPIAFVNHADHAFWVGASVCDVVVSLRASGAALAWKRRGVGRERSLVLPTPLDAQPSVVPREVAKAALGLPVESVVMLTSARGPKFDTEGLHFVDIYAPVLEAHPQAHLIAVGPRPNERWQALEARFPGRARRLDETPNTEAHLDAADIYLDSIPFASITSLLEAGSRGVPVASFSPWSPESQIFECGAPGLEGAILLGRNLEGHARNLSRLIRQPKQRAELGRRTQEQIMLAHTGTGWGERLEGVYDAARGLAVTPPAAADAPEHFGEPDTLVSIVFGRDPGCVTTSNSGWASFRRPRGSLPGGHCGSPAVSRCGPWSRSR